MTATDEHRSVADEEPLGAVVEVCDDGTVRIAMSLAQALEGEIVAMRIRRAAGADAMGGGAPAGGEGASRRGADAGEGVGLPETTKR